MKALKNTCIIDDDPLFVFGMKILIKQLGNFGDLMICENGEEAIECLSELIDTKKDLPNVIFLDINMPIMDGWEFLEGFQKIPFEARKNVAIYIVSSSIDSRDLERTKKIDLVNGYILKPITPEDLSSVLEEVA
ncbi:response regulator [Flagellimonas hymeniacidonis]|uniref:Response regulator n=1 Tax=Flagellimonas hymeniacidonis TaxID=2603628 RepID=A0A5C8UZY3_9FLAO|nr:response regulator [Flagellimonas hymeniacidonis]TXN34307.1 response regulator [Flagellimonas hymeniacidonis]